jgi:hypothetical protein
MGFRPLIVALAAAAVLGFSSNALASGGNYSIVGGTPFERLQVESALGASGFDWDMVAGPVTIHIDGGIVSHSLPGQIWLDSGLLDTGEFAWGVVQMEYAQQVQLSLVTAPMRVPLTALLGAQQWCYDDLSLPRSASACERFAAMLAWAYWPSSKNCMKPAGKEDWSSSMDPAAFRALLRILLGAPNVVPAEQSAAPERNLAAEHVVMPTPRRADGSVQLSLEIPAAGVVRVSGAHVVSTFASSRHAGVVRVWLRPKSALAPGTSRTVRVTVAFAPDGGPIVSALQDVTFAR